MTAVYESFRASSSTPGIAGGLSYILYTPAMIVWYRAIRRVQRGTGNRGGGRTAPTKIPTYHIGITPGPANRISLCLPDGNALTPGPSPYFPTGRTTISVRIELLPGTAKVIFPMPSAVSARCRMLFTVTE